MEEHTDILQRIVERNRPFLEERKRLCPEASLRKLAADAPARPVFSEAFSGAGIHVIAELKKASPSKGLIRSDLDVPRLAHGFEEAGAAALSVLTEPFFFLGSLENLRLAAASCALPLLRKEFIFDRYQLLEAKAAGASAVLLIAAMLPAEELRGLSHAAHDLGLQVLGEAHTSEELRIIAAANVDLLGVNARDLRTFATSLDRSAGLLREARELTSCPLIAESAVRTIEEIQMLRAAGARGFLIGETLMRAEDPATKLREIVQCC